MSRPLSFVTWQPLLTDHSAFTQSALPRAPDEAVVAYVGRTEDTERHAQGWVRYSAGLIPETVLPRRGWLSVVRQVLGSRRDSVHIFCSPFEDRRFFAAFLLSLWGGRRTYLVSEPYSIARVGYARQRRPLVHALKQKLRPAVYRVYAALMKPWIRGVFAISPLAVAQYRAAGIPAERLFPFGYFVPEPVLADVPVSDNAAPGRPLRLVFVGNLIARKGLADLAAAMEQARAWGLPVELDVYGSGDTDGAPFQTPGVRFRGSIPFGQASSVMATYDALVLPSVYDGWGVVVNEALQAGVPAICSRQTGAAALVTASGAGAVFTSGRPDELAERLREWVEAPEKLAAATQAARACRQTLTPEIAGRYMRAVIDHLETGAPRPDCPWYDCDPRAGVAA